MGGLVFLVGEGLQLLASDWLELLGAMLTVVVHHVFHVLEDLGVAAVRLSSHVGDIGLALVKHSRRLGVDDEGDGQQRLNPFW